MLYVRRLKSEASVTSCNLVSLLFIVVFFDRRLRPTVLELACTVGHTECLDEAGEIFKKWIRDSNDTRPHPDIRQLIYYYGKSTDY